MRVTVVRQGQFKTWNPGRIVYEAKDDNDALEFISENLERFKHLYIDYVYKKEVKDGSHR